MWFTDQQHPHRLGTCQKCTLSGPTQHPPSGAQQSVSISPLRDSDTSSSLPITHLELFWCACSVPSCREPELLPQFTVQGYRSRSFEVQAGSLIPELSPPWGCPHLPHPVTGLDPTLTCLLPAHISSCKPFGPFPVMPCESYGNLFLEVKICF